MRSPVFIALYLTLLLNNSLQLVYVVYAKQTIEEQKIKFDFKGEIKAIYTGLLL